jgi:hypothetical protein
LLLRKITQFHNQQDSAAIRSGFDEGFFIRRIDPHLYTACLTHAALGTYGGVFRIN